MFRYFNKDTGRGRPRVLSRPGRPRSAADASGRDGRLPDARPGLDPLRGARPSRLRGRDEEALPELQGALPERRRRRLASSSSSSTPPSRRAPRRSCSTRSIRPRPPRWSSRRRARASRSSPMTGRSRRRQGRLLRLVRQRGDRQGDRQVAGQASEGEERCGRRRRLLEINGSPTDAAAGLIKKGIHEGLADSGYKTLAEYDTPEWAAAQGAAMGQRPDLALRQEDRRRGRGQRRHRRRRDRGLQGGRRRSGAAGDRQRRDHRRRCSSSSRATSTTRSPSRARSSRRRRPMSPSRF